MSGTKDNFFGAYENASLNHVDYGDIIYARQGEPEYGFIKMKATGYAMNETGPVIERTIGTAGNWNTNDTTIHYIRFTWKDGIPSIQSTGGSYNVSLSQLGGYPIMSFAMFL